MNEKSWSSLLRQGISMNFVHVSIMAKEVGSMKLSRIFRYHELTEKALRHLQIATDILTCDPLTTSLAVCKLAKEDVGI